MQAYAGITYIELGGAERPLKFGTNQTGKFCEMRGIDIPEYSKIVGSLNELGAIRDLLFSALWAGAKSEKLPVDFDSYDVGDWMDVAGLDNVMAKLTSAITGVANPNEAAQEKPKMKKVK